MAYRVSLKDFEGPLDLLLTLIGKAKIDIKDIFVSQITEQYLSYMDGLNELDMDSASEFLAMAATLLEIKSRAMLPRPQPAAEGEETPEEELVRRLEEYKAIKEACARMHDLESAARAMLTKLPEEYPLPPKVYELTGLSLDGLTRALRSLLDRVERDEESRGAPAERRIRRDDFNVAACQYRIQKRLRRGPVAFFDLFSPRASRTEIISVFLALLELIKLSRATVYQQSLFSDIVIMPVLGGAPDEGGASEYDAPESGTDAHAAEAGA